MKKLLLIPLLLMSLNALAQDVMTPELLWKLGRLTPLGLSNDGKNIVYKVTYPSVAENKSYNILYIIAVNGGASTEVQDTKTILKDKNISPDGKYIVYNE